MKEILDNLDTLHIERNFSMSTQTFDALKAIQRKAQADQNRDISVNRIMNAAIIHYAILYTQGKI